MKARYSEALYFPPTIFFVEYFLYEKVYLCSQENFDKQSYRNRTTILSANGKLDLIVPVQKGKSKLNSGEVLIANSENWKLKHLRSIQTAYGKSPYYIHYAHLIGEFYEREFTSIFDLGYQSIEWVVALLKMGDKLNAWHGTLEDVPGDKRFAAIHPKPHRFLSQVVTKEVAYFQCFNEDGFTPGLSILDLLFNEGPNSIEIIKEMAGSILTYSASR